MQVSLVQLTGEKGYVPAKNETFEEPKVKNRTDVILSDELYWYVPILNMALPPELLRRYELTSTQLKNEKLTKPRRPGSWRR